MTGDREASARSACEHPGVRVDQPVRSKPHSVSHGFVGSVVEEAPRAFVGLELVARAPCIGADGTAADPIGNLLEIETTPAVLGIAALTEVATRAAAHEDAKTRNTKLVAAEDRTMTRSAGGKRSRKPSLSACSST